MVTPALRCVKLTKRTVDALPPGNRDQVIFDAEVPGFGPRITPSGRKVFLVQCRYRPGRSGHIRRYTIGAYGEGLTPDQARSIALQMKGKLAAGVDPVSGRETILAEAQRTLQEKKRKDVNSVQAIAAAFIERHAKPRLRSWREYERMLEHFVLPEWGSRQITDIRRSDVTALLDRVEEKRSSALADHILAVIRKTCVHEAGSAPGGLCIGRPQRLGGRGPAQEYVRHAP